MEILTWLSDTFLSAAGQIVVIIIAALVGYFFASFRSYREQKQKAYAEIVPPIVRVVYSPQPADEEAFNRALMKLWLYANKDVAKKMDSVVSRILKGERGKAVTKLLQEAIVAMRSDIQFWRAQRLDPEEVQHLYMGLVEAPRLSSGEGADNEG